MLSKYFELKTKTKEFEEHVNTLINKVKDKKVILYGAGEGFIELNKKYKFNEVLNVLAIADKKFDSVGNTTFEGMRAISPNQIINEEYEIILITCENTKRILEFIYCDLEIDDKDIRTVFNEDIPDEQVNYNYLIQYNFGKTLKKLIKKLKNKKVMFYGAGSFLELIKRYYDISPINVIGIADRRFAGHGENEVFLDYKVYAPDEIASANPDVVVVATKFYMNIIEDLCYKTLKGKKIKVIPLVKKPFWTLMKEIWK